MKQRKKDFKFKIGDIIKHKISKKKWIIVDISYPTWTIGYRTRYVVRNGKYTESSWLTEVHFYEEEIEKCPI